MNNNQEIKSRKTSNHNVVLFNKKQMTVSGVIRVENFNESTIVLVTEFGQLTIEGTNLHISKLSLETGDMNIDGDIAGLFYSGDFDSAGKKTSGLFGKIFK
jgi:sporulation protein YabP